MPITFANPLHNTFAIGRQDPRNTAAFRTYAGETWDEAMARQAHSGCTTAWIRERWQVVKGVSK